MSTIIEAANRAEATAMLIRAGFRVYRPEADVAGEDLVVRTPGGLLNAVQLKSRLHVNWEKYGEQGLWMLFPATGYRGIARSWYLVDHDLLFAILWSKHH